MTSSSLTFDLNNNLIQSLSTSHAHVQILGPYYEVNRGYANFNDRG